MTETTGTEKTLETMEAEVEQYCRDKGWYDTDVPFSVAMALLHEEAAEAGHAWREHGLDDMTVLTTAGDPEPGQMVNVIVKPEGVGSELADIFIRLLDDSARYGLDLPARARDARLFSLSGDFLHEINTLHDLISRASISWQGGGDRYAVELAGVHAFLRQMAGYYGVDLTAEYERKMQFNRTRPYRHGGRRA
jgi:NTP pyrophosphatase (non-canonical NTP hydrolase)